MKIALIHPSQGFGQRIRIEAIQRYLQANDLSVTAIDLAAPSLKSSVLDIHSVMEKILRNISSGYRFSKYCDAYHKIANLINLPFQDYQYIHAENHEGALVANFLKQRFGIPYVFDMHGLAVEEARGRGDSIVVLEFLRKLESHVIAEAHAICVVSEVMRDYLNTHYGYAKEKIVIVPCGSDLYHRQAQYSEPFRIVYAGGDGYYEKIQDFFMTPCAYFKKPTSARTKVEFIHIGRFPNIKESSYYEGQRWGIKTRSETLAALTSMHIGIAPSTNDLARVCASPVKIADYAACGLPIICPDIGEWSDNVRRYDAGIVCEESSPRLFSDSIEKMRSRDIWEKKSSNALQMAREVYDWNIVLNPLLEIYT